MRHSYSNNFNRTFVKPLRYDFYLKSQNHESLGMGENQRPTPFYDTVDQRASQLYRSHIDSILLPMVI